MSEARVATHDAPFFFTGSKGRKLFGFLHVPKIKPGQAPLVGLVHVHPFGEEKQMAHAVTVRTARQMAEAGFAVLRFDFSGCGDSEAELDEVTVEEWLEEIALAMQELKDRTGVTQVILWGLRSGAGLILAYLNEAVSEAQKPKGILLWQPQDNLEMAMHQFLRQKIGTALAAAGINAGSSTALMQGSGAASNVPTVKGLLGDLSQGNRVEVMGYPLRDPLVQGFISRKRPTPELPKFDVEILALGAAAEPTPAIATLAGNLRATGADVGLTSIIGTSFWDAYWRYDEPPFIASTLERMQLRWG